MKGIVIDEKSSEGLAFVNIISNNQWIGSTGIDGRFAINYSGNDLVFSFIGYETLTFNPATTPLPPVIRMKQKMYELSEIVIRPGENPAHRIIANAIKNSKKNNPKSLSSFSYKAYDKMVISADTNSLINSTEPLKAFFEKRDLMVMETVSERSYRFPARQKEQILATRVSGLKDPAIVFLLSQLHSTDFYGEMIEIDGKKHLSPLSRSSLANYLFALEETIPDGSDTLFVISFAPRKGSNFESLRGKLGIHSDGWAVQSVTASPFHRQGTYQMQIRQLYQKIDSNHWFPVQLNTRLIFDNLKLPGNPVLIGEGSSFYTDIRINEDSEYQYFTDFAIQMHPKAVKRSESFWTDYRADSLSERHIETYRFIDSLGQAANFDKLLYSVETIIEGKIPLGMFDISVDQLLKFNNFEGFKPGFELSTNRRLSKKFSLSVYGGYPVRDERPVYNAKLTIPVFKKKQAYFQFNIFNDNKPTGSTVNLENNRSLTNERSFRQYFVNKMDRIKGGEIHAAIKILPNLGLQGTYSDRRIQPAYPYMFRIPVYLETGQSQFRSSEFKLSLQYRHGETLIQLTDRIIKTGIPNPIITLSASRITFNQSIPIMPVNKLEFSFEQRFDTKFYGSSTFRIEAGVCGASMPFPLLFNLPGTRDPYGLYAPFSFVSMFPNEFVVDQYAAVFWQHNFGKLIFGNRRFAPQPMLVSNIAFGRMLSPGNHVGLDFRVPELGFFESGIMLRDILKMSFTSLGIGSMYRFGPYRFPEARKNLTLNLVVSVKMP